MKKTIKPLLNVVLQDNDNAEGTGGIAYKGETVRDFAESCQLPLDIELSKFNKILEDCGIQAI